MILDVVNGYSFEVEQEVKEIWTIIDDSVTETSILKHNQNAFKEDNYHDWNQINNKIHFFAHSGSKGELHRIIIIFK
jgi:hypothetical protein